MIPEPIAEAFQALKSSSLIAITSELEQPAGQGYVKFSCELPAPVPNAEGVSDSVSFEVRIPLAFPFGKVEFIPLAPELRGFPHQGSKEHALCLFPSEGDYPWSATEKLRCYVESAIQWIDDAVNGRLLDKDQIWELPDFRTGLDACTLPLLFVESHDSYSQWSSRVGQSGTAELAKHCTGNAIVAVRFLHEGKPIHTAPVSKGFYYHSQTSLCEWILLSSLCFHRHRPPLRFRELEELCRRDSIDIWQILRQAVRRTTFDDCYHVLIGAPIPRIVRGPLVEIHWARLVLPKRMLDDMPKVHKSLRGNETVLRERLQNHVKNKPSFWAKSVNMAPGRMLARGSLSEIIRGKRICLVGCGAIGALVAEHLARGGVYELSLMDDDVLEFENLVRHPLAPQDVGNYKAKALAVRLMGLFPNATIAGFSAKIPDTNIGPEHDGLREQLKLADAIIDCTADESAFRWLSRYGRAEGKPIVHIYTNPHCRLLTLCISGRHISCLRVADRLNEDVANTATPFSMAEYYPAEEIEPGAGCWQATFPARGSDIAALVGAAIPILERFLGTEPQSKGTAVVLRRNDLRGTTSSQALIEIVWARDYR